MLVIGYWRVDPPFSTSDHDSITFTIVNDAGLTDNSLLSSDLTPKLCWNKADWPGFALFCSEIDWNFVSINCVSPEECWAIFTEILNIGIDQYVPKEAKRNPNRVFHNTEIRKLQSRKKSLLEAHEG